MVNTSDTVSGARERDQRDARGTPVLTRVSFRFSANGLSAACLAGGYDNLQLETWSFEGSSPQWRPLLLAQPITIEDQPVALDHGRILLCRNHARMHDITLIEPCDGAARERVLAVVDSQGCGLLPGLSGHDFGNRGRPPDPLNDRGRPPDPLGVAITFDGACSTIWRVSAHPPQLVRLTELTGLLDGGAWLDRTATVLGANRIQDGGPAKAVAVDLRDGKVTPLLNVTETSNDRLLACSPRSGLLLVSTDARGGQRLGWGKLGARKPARFPATLHRLGQAAAPLAFDPGGQHVLLQFDEGARSRLAIYKPAQDRLTLVRIPPGCVRGTAYWAEDVLRFPFSSPSQPPCVATVRPDGTGRCSLAGHKPNGRRWADAHIERLKGPYGPVEAIVYGGEGWRASSRLLLALHGGPVDAWRFEFEPFFQVLAAAGIAIVAPNQRGSSGYGAEHTRPVRGAWGGPDLDDICFIARGLCAQRRALGRGQLMLCGHSYGAFLALLAASCAPDLWSHCLVLAPFLSARRLFREAAPKVQSLIEQLGGLQELHDELGPRDVLRRCHAIRAKLLIVHGDRDEVIPVTQSRALRRRLLELGRREGVHFDYVEVTDDRHELLARVTNPALRERLLGFLRTDGGE